MTDEDAFLAAIRAAPGDDTARLVYADWLDERGEAEKATFLRLECERPARGARLARLRQLGDPLPTDWLAAVSRPALLGTTWAERVPHGTGEPEVYRFDPAGVLRYGETPSRRLRPSGQWRQVGPWVRFSVNHFEDGKPYTFFEGPVRADRLDLRMTWRGEGARKSVLVPVPSPAAKSRRRRRG